MRESKAYEEIMSEGRLEMKRADVYEAVHLRYGQKAAVEFQQAIHESSDLKQLSKLHRLAIRGRPLSEMRRAVATLASQRE
jgi:hypothetical protein